MRVLPRFIFWNTSKKVKCGSTDTSASFVQEIFNEAQQNAQKFIDEFLDLYVIKTLKDFNLAKRGKQLTKSEQKLGRLLLSKEADVIYDCIDEIANKLTNKQISFLAKILLTEYKN